MVLFRLAAAAGLLLLLTFFFAASLVRRPLPVAPGESVDQRVDPSLDEYVAYTAAADAAAAADTPAAALDSPPEAGAHVTEPPIHPWPLTLAGLGPVPSFVAVSGLVLASSLFLVTWGPAVLLPSPMRRAATGQDADAADPT